MRVPIGVPGGGVWGRVQVGGGGLFSCGKRGEKEEGGGRVCGLSGSLNRLNAILSLLQPLDRYRAPSAIGSAIGGPLSRPISPYLASKHRWESSTASFQTAWRAQPRDSGAIVSKTPPPPPNKREAKTR